MHIWGTGVFDNAPAVEWAEQFDRTTAVRRAALVRSALATALRADDQRAWLVALGAATTVAAALPGGPLLADNTGPKSLLDNQFQPSVELAAAAVETLEQCMSVHTEWTRLWTRAALLDDAVAVVDAVIEELEERTALTVRVREAS
ncbi:DUF4259 domain-containing protein [Williamsia muralis]|uniref:DUF4259 domain-containing protein n=1 Tax=Williamsia marianensis TaxID=85044 RepID=UPI003F140902